MEVQKYKVSKLEITKNLDALFALDKRIAGATKEILPLETKGRFLEFFTKEHDSNIWVCKGKTGKLLGYIALISKPDEGSMEILNVGVDPSYQSKGYGRKMIEFAEEKASDAHINNITLVTNKKNINAIGFFKHMGYSIAREMPNYYGGGEVRYLFKKTLINSSF